MECAVPDELTRVAALFNSTSSRCIALLRNGVGAAASIAAGAEEDAKHDAKNDEEGE